MVMGRKHIRTEKATSPTGNQGVASEFCSFAEAVLSFHERFPFLHASGPLGYGVQRWTNRGYKHTSRM